MISSITDDQLVEGIIGATVWGIFWIYLRKFLKLSSYIEGAISWILVWLCRKFGISLYQNYKKRYKLKDFNFKIL